MLSAWLHKNKLNDLSDISNPEQLEPFHIYSLYTKETAKVLDIPYLPPKPYLSYGHEFTSSKQILPSLQDHCSLLYLLSDMQLDKQIDLSILSTFLSKKLWKPEFASISSRSTQPCFFIEDATEPTPKGTSRGYSAEAIVKRGANKTQEVAFIIKALLQDIKNIDLHRIHFTFFNDSHFLLDIAKIRAFRFLYASLLHANGYEVVSPHIHIRCHPLYFTQNEEWMNIKRQGVAVFSALLANSQSISIAPFNYRNQMSSALDAFRVSRNTIHILKEESHLWNVYDPVKGSYQFESVTHDLAKAAWDISNDASYDFSQQVNTIHKKRLALYKEKKLDLIGTTIYQAKEFTAPQDKNYLDGLIYE